MRHLEESSTRWQRTIKQATSLADLKLAVRLPGDASPCVSGLRSVCWKVFLLYQTVDVPAWSGVNKDARDAYKSLRDHFLKYIERPEEIGSALDPLDDDKNSPWNTLRQDEELRAEILQDVERCMPDEEYFRDAETQRMLLDILFIYCKLNHDVGYRQGMHELLAPILWVIEMDAIDSIGKGSPESDTDQVMLETLDARYIEHDAFTIFSLLMQSAKSFYELGELSQQPNNAQNSASPIVERSKRIHEVYLARVDPDLATHLTAVEVLPQIFLIRWIRLMFGREFPFDSLLALWDTLFAEDPALDLIDMICVAMLLRIRWQLIEADYSVALTLLLKYPAPESPHGPQTFVEDAIYLRNNFSMSSGAHIVSKYSGRALPSSKSQPVTPSGRTLSPEVRGSRRPSPLPSPVRFLQQQGGVNALLQGAAKGAYERGERLGINQAVRDAVVEVKRNLQSVSPSGPIRGSDATRWSLDEGRAVPSTRKSIASLEQRNKQLSLMLQEALDDLRKLQLPESVGQKQAVEMTDLAIAKIQFVQVYLDDSSIPLPLEVRNTDEKTSSSAVPELINSGLTPPNTSENQKLHKPTVAQRKGPPLSAGNLPDTSMPASSLAPSDTGETPTTINTSETPAVFSEPLVETLTEADRPRAPMPTRSSLAQSSFAWMLEPDETPTSSGTSSSPKTASPFLPTAKPVRSGPNREKTAFLFGDEIEDILDPIPKSKRNSVQAEPEDGFILGTMKGKKAR